MPGRDLSIFEVNEIAASDKHAVEFLLNRLNLRGLGICNRPQCGRELSLQHYACGTDGYVLRCSKCKARSSIRKGTFWERCKLNAKQIVFLVYFWAARATNKQIETYINVSKPTCIDFLNFLREITSWKVLQHSEKLGGLGKIVQIDESVVYKPKYNVGHGFQTPAKWIFGAYDVEQKIGYVQFVDSRDSNALFPIIQQWIEPGTEIHSDRWASYSGISNIPVFPPYIHKTVNHSENFVDPITGAHTNNVEAYWSSVKRKFKILSGTSRSLTASYLDEHMWRNIYGSSTRSAFDSILAQIAEKYPLN